ncbi:hypothetical protein OSTOST_25821 [Ostertagia ostertagi]
MSTTPTRSEYHRKETRTTPAQMDVQKRNFPSGPGRHQPKKPATVQAHAEARIPKGSARTQVTPSSGKSSTNEMAESRARTRPYNLRPRTPKSDAQEAKYGNNWLVTPGALLLNGFYFHIMILSLIQVCSGCATPPGGLEMRQEGVLLTVTTAPQVLDTCANEMRTKNVFTGTHLNKLSTIISSDGQLSLQYVACDNCACVHITNEKAWLFQKELGASISARMLTTLWLALSILLRDPSCMFPDNAKHLPHVPTTPTVASDTEKPSSAEACHPPLPEPGVLYDKIVVLCTDHYTHTQAVTSIEEKVRRLRSSDKSSQQRISEISSLNLEIDYLYLQFRFCRSQLLTFFSLPPLLIAMDKMTKQYWETLMSQPQEVSHNKALIMDMDSLEDITSDQLQMLNSLRSSLNDLRIEAQNDTEEERLTFEREVRDRLDQIQKLALGLQDAVVNPSREPHAANQEAGEGIRRIREENDVIRDNEGFIEGVMEMDESEAEDEDESEAEDEEQEAEEDLDDDNMDHLAHDDLSDSEEEREEHEEEHRPDDEELDRNHIPDDIPQREDRRRSAIQIEQEIRSAEQAVRNFEEIFASVRTRAPLPTTSLSTKGKSLRGHRASLLRLLYHIRDPFARREMITRTGRCRTCLERMCSRGSTCKKYITPCYYCRERGHHSSLCDFPEHSDYIRSRLEAARDGRIRSLNKLHDLRRELAYIGYIH